PRGMYRDHPGRVPQEGAAGPDQGGDLPPDHASPVTPAIPLAASGGGVRTAVAFAAINEDGARLKGCAAPHRGSVNAEVALLLKSDRSICRPPSISSVASAPST